MSTNTDHETIEELIRTAAQRERRRCVGLALAAFGRAKLAGLEDTARILDALATSIEHDDGLPSRENE